MKQKKSILVLSLVFVFAIALAVVIPFVAKKKDKINVTLFYPMNNESVTYKVEKGENFLNNIKPCEFEGYEFVGWFYNNDLSFEVKEDASFTDSITLIGGYSKVVKKTSNEPISENNKFLTIKTTDNAVLTASELKNLLNSGVKYLDLSEAEFESATLNDEFSSSLVNYLKLPKNIQTISDGAFQNCYELKTLTLNENVKEVNDLAFYNCTNLEEIDFPNSIESLGDKIFLNSGIKNATFGKNLKTITKETFNGAKLENISVDKDNLFFINIENAIYSLNKETLYYAMGNGDFTAIEETKVISPYAFSQSKFKNVTIGKNIETIGERAFENCKELGKVEILDANNYVIEREAFKNCQNLCEIKLGLGLSSMGEYAFEKDINIKEVIFNSSTAQDVKNLETIKRGAFKDCVKLERITLPDSVKTLESEAFYNCSSLKEITLSSKIKAIEEKTFYNNKKLEKVVSDGEIETIGNYAFELCDKLENIDSLLDANNIKIGAFKNCKSLKNANFNNLTKICEQTFAGCENLERTSFDKLEELGSRAFEGCKILETFKLESGVQTFNEDAFNNSGLKEIISLSPHFYSEDGILYNEQKNAIICYPIMKNDVNFTIKASILKISSTLFFENPYLRNIDVEEENVVFTSSRGAVYSEGGTRLIKYANNDIIINIDEGVKVISKNAFSGSNALKISLPSSIERIEMGAFEGVKNLYEISLPFIGETKNDNKFFGYIFGASSYNENEYYIPESLKSVILTHENEIGEYSFYCANNITKLEANKEVNAIRGYAFYNDTSLREVVFNGSIVEIEEYSFYNVNSLETLTFGFDPLLRVADNSLQAVSNNVNVSIHNNNQTIPLVLRQALKQKFSWAYDIATSWRWYFI